MLSAEQATAFEPFLVELNRASSAAILPLFRNLEAIENKKAHLGDFDPVTAADRGAEAAIRQLIAERYPDHGVIGEEYGEDRPDAEFVWVVDPVDGTRAFVAGLPVWTTLIALRHQGRPVLGSIGQPYIGELFLGHAGGARLMSQGSSRPLKTRRGVPLATRSSRPPIPDRTCRPASPAPGNGCAPPPASPAWAATPTPTPWWPTATSTW